MSKGSYTVTFAIGQDHRSNWSGDLTLGNFTTAVTANQIGRAVTQTIRDVTGARVTMSISRHTDLVGP